MWMQGLFLTLGLVLVTVGVGWWALAHR